jgi:hypothetical protein
MSTQRNRSAPPDNGLPVVASFCDNGHQWAGEMAWLLPLVFPEDIELTRRCPTCGAKLFVASGTYEPDPAGVYRRVGPPDPSVVVPIGDG